ncbi:MAG TPA: radical SAM family heme chaperone HemW [Bacteroidales bacterium]|nr:radical SAM family heme chaperone HemW [Bacteroidales bacterium]HRR15903.1 radical SAM family heme chaperone HemW [Bacteroidales bacterium]HRT47981.1 radical SAM family heme chaperone HemW [Bacteroidales bacterium]
MAGIYIHIPFCKSICHYCDFYKVLDEDNHSRFINAVLLEAKLRKDYLSGESVSTIYLGGGTPSVLSVKELSDLIDGLYGIFNVENDCEITIEVNPDDVGIEWLNEIRKIGFNRLSYGIQSWNDDILRMLNRRHNSKQAAEALIFSEKAGFENISVDLIYGIPGYDSASWGKDLEQTFGYNIKHLSAYHMTIKPETFFGKLKKAGKLNELDEEESNNQFNLLIEKAENAGFIQYEISNFAKEGWFSKHNSNYWRQVIYIGLGPSAHSFNRISRQWNISNLEKYISAVESNKKFYTREELDNKKIFNEYILTSLRTMWGIDLDYIEINFSKEGYDYVMNLSRKFIDYGLMRLENNHLVLTNTGKMISDNIISEFMMV